MFVKDTKTGNEVYLEFLRSTCGEHPIVAVENDLGAATTMVFGQECPDRRLECGIAEGNSITVSASLSEAGFIPFVHSMTPFITRRAYDQIVISAAYSKQSVKILGSNPGIYSEMNGGTHLSIEDAGIMRNVPDLITVSAADNVAFKAFLEMCLETPGNIYVRFYNKLPNMVYEEGQKFEFGKANLLREGKDVTIFANDLMVSFSIEAAKLLAQEGIEATVYDMHTIKPIDKGVILEAAGRGPIVTAENHSVVNGLGSAVAEVLADAGAGVKLRRIGIQDRFGIVGTLDFIAEELGMRPQDIAAAAKSLL
ncbi:MAG: transketolase family protein [Christensenellales bacterium]|jgi:transketolase